MTSGTNIPFIGRAAEIEHLRASLRRAAAGQASLALVQGEAGVGKTALIESFLESLDAENVLRCGADEDEASLSFGLVSQLFASTGRGHGVATHDAMRIGAAVLELLDTLQKDAPGVFVIDDAHWCDAESLRALTFALRRLGGDRVLTIVAARPDGERRLPSGLVKLAQSPGSVRLVLEPLDATEMAALAAHAGVDPSPHAVDRLLEHSGGNPLHATSLLRELPAESFAEVTDTPLPAPTSFAGLSLARIAALPEPTRRLLGAAAVLGHATSFDAAAKVADVADGAAASEPAIGAGLMYVLRPGAPDARIAFAHPLIRSTVYHDLGPAVRAELHARAAEVSPDAVTKLRHRAAAVLGPDDDLAEEIRTAARGEVARGRAGTAASLSLLGARLSSDAAIREQMLVDAVLHAWAAGDVSTMTEVLATSDRFESAPHRLFMASLSEAFHGRHPAAMSLLEEAWQLGSHDRRLAVVIASGAAGNRQWWGDPAESAMWARRAFENASGDGETGQAAWDLLVALALSGRSSEALDLVREHDGRLAAPGRERPYWLMGRGVVRMWTDDLAGALEDLRTAVRVWRRDPVWWMALMAMQMRAEAAYRAGSWDEALSVATLGASFVDDMGIATEIGMPMHQGVAASVLAARGEWSEAERRIDDAERQARFQAGRTPFTVGAWLARARLHDAKHDPAGVVTALEPLAVWPPTGTAEFTASPWAGLYAESLVAVGRLDDARSAIDELRAATDATDRPSPAAAASRASARLASATDDDAAAVAGFGAALAASSQAAQPFELALTELAFGEHLRRRGSRREAVEHLQAAKEALEPLGARPYIERCERELAACGLAPPRRRVRDPVALTPQERNVVHLVRQGMTNREIANELVLSVRTIEFHVSNALLKLGVSSRRELR